MLNQEIKSRITRLWDMFWAGGLTNPITAIEQISYLLFMRRLEDVRQNLDEQVKWSVYTDIYSQEELVIHIKNVVFPYIKVLHDENDPFSLAMLNSSFEIIKPSLLQTAVDLINEIYNVAENERKSGQHFQDTLGDFYEYLLKETSEAGKNGQFRTPRHLIELMCELINPDIKDKICDVTAGTAGFLVGAYQHIVSKYSTEGFQTDENGFERSIKGDKLANKQKSKLFRNTFYGYDIDQTMIRLGLMNLIMHNIAEPKIKRLDSLSKQFDKSEKDIQYSIILANPPFTGRIDSLGVGNTLNRVYELKSKLDKKTNKETGPSIQTEILFLERIVQLLQINGRAAVIVPEGVLFGSANAPKKIREILLKDCDLQAVISLPSGAFMPYTGVKTSILIFIKKQFKSDEYHTNQVWFYGLNNDGYSLDANRKPLKDKPLPEVVKAFNNRYNQIQENRKGKSFFVPIQEIINKEFQLSYNQYKDFVYNNQEYQEPKILLSQILELEKEILTEIEILKSVL